MHGIKDWLETRQAEIERPYDSPPEPDYKKVTVRVPLDVFHKLDYIAVQTLQAKTACAEDLLVMAIEEAHKSVQAHPFFSQLKSERQGVDPVNDEELEQVLAAARAAGGNF
jgi:hypothetical protein